jgi:cellulose synthase/poly-beta-1,6-N-acetylglucosamine synthase-like glycosyltransferase
MTPLLLGLYFTLLGLLSVYGLHRLQMLWLFYRHRHRLAGSAPRLGSEPVVTVQLPLYNEANVARRLIEAVCALDWPASKLQIQVLDDSTDETTGLVAEAVERGRAAGIDITQVRRGRRTGYKAGALASGLSTARGEFIAVFDADFVPPPSFLRDLLPRFADPRTGMVQARWEHLHRRWSLLTRVQSVMLDGHFVIEHAARNASGRFFNFNGTAGIWRRACIDASGGWQHDTLTEDLDLSYRAQLAGWNFIYVPQVCAPAELPIEMDGFKSQQYRWAKGSIQTARKLLGRVTRDALPAHVKLEAWMHLTANACYPLVVLLAILLVPALHLRTTGDVRFLAVVDLPLFLLSSLSLSGFYGASQAAIGEGGRGGWRTLALMPALMATGIGLSVNNTRAVLEGLFQSGGEFRRTPKTGTSDARTPAPRRAYAADRTMTILVEAALCLYLTGGLIEAALDGRYAAVPFLAIFAWGFGFTAALSLAERVRAAQLRRRLTSRAEAWSAG